MRVVGGKHRGRGLTAPTGSDTRPTTDRTREALFNILAHADWVEIEEACVLDAFCGTGALGLEALSRGARSAVFMDLGRAALEATRANVAALGETEAATVLRADATRPPRARDPATLVFLDPPYRRGLAAAALVALSAAGWFAPGAAVVVEEAADAGFVPPKGFSLIDRRCYGGTTIYFLTAPAREPVVNGDGEGTNDV